MYPRRGGPLFVNTSCSAADLLPFVATFLLKKLSACAAAPSSRKGPRLPRPFASAPTTPLRRCRPCADFLFCGNLRLSCSPRVSAARTKSALFRLVFAFGGNQAIRLLLLSRMEDMFTLSARPQTPSRRPWCTADLLRVSAAATCGSPVRQRLPGGLSLPPNCAPRLAGALCFLRRCLCWGPFYGANPRRQWAKQFAPALFVVLPPRFGVGGCLAGVSQRQVAAPPSAALPPFCACAGADALLAARVGAVNRAPLAAFFARGDATSTLLRRLSRKGGSPHPFGL